MCATHIPLSLIEFGFDLDLDIPSYTSECLFRSIDASYASGITKRKPKAESREAENEQRSRTQATWAEVAVVSSTTLRRSPRQAQHISFTCPQ